MKNVSSFADARCSTLQISLICKSLTSPPLNSAPISMAHLIYFQDHSSEIQETPSLQFLRHFRATVVFGVWAGVKRMRDSHARVAFSQYLHHLHRFTLAPSRQRNPTARVASAHDIAAYRVDPLEVINAGNLHGAMASVALCARHCTNPLITSLRTIWKFFENVVPYQNLRWLVKARAVVVPHDNLDAVKPANSAEKNRHAYGKYRLAKSINPALRKYGVANNSTCPAPRNKRDNVRCRMHYNARAASRRQWPCRSIMGKNKGLRSCDKYRLITGHRRIAEASLGVGEPSLRCESIYEFRGWLKAGFVLLFQYQTEPVAFTRLDETVRSVALNNLTFLS